MLCCLLVLGQQPSNNARINGVVLDIAGAAIPEVQITIQNPTASYEVVSDSGGKFQVDLLPGVYEVRSDKLPGFAATNRRLEIGTNKTVEVTIVPQVSLEGAICILEVTAGPPENSQSKPTANEFFKMVRESKEPLMVDGERIYRATEVTARPVLTSKPEPQFTDEARKKKTEGLVELIVVFESSGEVKVLYVLQELPHGLTERAMKAAVRIKFKPAILDDKPVSQVMFLEYHFHR
jgi:hypothetical protein